MADEQRDVIQLLEELRETGDVTVVVAVRLSCVRIRPRLLPRKALLRVTLHGRRPD